MKLFTKKRLLLFIGIATVLGLAQCDSIRADVSQVFFPPAELDFPMGEGKQVSYPIRSLIDKPYGIGLVIEYANWGKTVDKEIQKEIPYSFSIICYRIEKDREVLFFQRYYSKEDELYWGQGYVPKQSYSPNTRALSIGLGGFRLPYGRYRCDFKDTSSSEITAYLQKAGIVRTFVHIVPFEPLIY